jgi:hypothetical protein
MTRQATLALVIVLGVLCLITTVASRAAQDPADSSWWAAWAVLCGSAVAIIGAVWLYRRSARVTGDIRGPSSPAPLAHKAGETAQALGQGLGCMFFVGICFVAGGYLAVWFLPSNEIANKWRYSLEDDLNGATITIDPIPHDCEFLSAPLGAKHCHYEKRVVTVRIRINASHERLVSYDDGKTWGKADPTEKPAVYVSWAKIAD